MGKFMQLESMLSEIVCTIPDIYNPIGKFRADGRSWNRALNASTYKPNATLPGHRLHLACNVTTVTDRRPPPRGRNSEC